MTQVSHSLHSRSAAERAAAVRELTSKSHSCPELPSEIYQALGDKSNLVVAAAAEAFAKHPQDNAIRALVERYWWMAENGPKHDPGCLARIAILKALVACRAAEAVTVFQHAIVTYQPEKVGLGMDDTAVALRSQAAGAMAELQTSGALMALAILLFDQEPRVPHAPEERLYINMAARVAAARCLAALGEAGGVAVLGVRLAHGDAEIPEVLVECMDALAVLDAAAAVQMITPYLTSPMAYLAAGAATSLASLPSPWHSRVIASLTEACSTASKDAQEPLALALASMRSDAVVPALVDLAGHQSVGVRLAAVAGLRQRADAVAIAGLRQIASRKGDKAVAAAAKAALVDLGQDS